MVAKETKCSVALRRLQESVLAGKAEAVRKRFMKYVIKTEGCWLWTGGKHGRGYGQFGLFNSPVNAHRVALVLAGTQVPSDRLCCHHCDNMLCVRPDHLFVGTWSDNMMDCSQKGRHHCVKKTHCLHGHPYKDPNIYYLGDGTRRCLICKRKFDREKWRLRASLAAVKAAKEGK